MKLLDKYDVMKQTGFSEAQVNKLLKEKVLSYVQIKDGGKRLVPQESLDAFLGEYLVRGKF